MWWCGRPPDASGMTNDIQDTTTTTTVRRTGRAITVVASVAGALLLWTLLSLMVDALIAANAQWMVTHRLRILASTQI